MMASIAAQNKKIHLHFARLTNRIIAWLLPFPIPLKRDWVSIDVNRYLHFLEDVNISGFKCQKYLPPLIQSHIKKRTPRDGGNKWDARIHSDF